MATSIRISFEGSAREYTATSWNVPRHHEPFEALPTDTIVLSRANSLLINGLGDRRPRKVSFEYAGGWGIEGDPEEGVDSSLIYGQGQSVDGPTTFCLRFIFNVVAATRDKNSLTFRTYARLIKDAHFHSKHLVKAEGMLVPSHYGMWLMDTGDWAGHVLCSITQWCGKPWTELSRTKMNTEANKMLIGRTVEFLHDYGVIHGGFSAASGFRHLIFDVHAPGLSPADLLNGKAPCYIVDFGDAQAQHTCARKLPILPLDAFVTPNEVGCAETTNTLFSLQFSYLDKPRLTPGCKTYRAIQYHDEYLRLHSDWGNPEVLLAQRAKLFKHRPPLYPELHVTFVGDDEYSRAVIEMEAFSDDELELSEDDNAAREDSASPETPSDSLEAVDEKLRLAHLDDLDMIIIKPSR